ncbi:6-phosphogluconolactonase [Nocardia sp. CDC159]|uniref:6-phosphogluconolactonase n=1 Tax=Nocardia pulmonis TaxID=2951408 RepID=A0A9X2J043_9NOCA|nr:MULTISPECIES: 6-phosphogluconolactonase [Nocardia]MCM6776710.1 6-phosphogluconolactonase [Nocardia pulmonis]MCM6789141.1 6-phosphogluconolactonase [Nocardia sp. CDC159]
MSEPGVEILADTDALAVAAAERFVEIVTAAQRARGRASVVVTGGGTGIATLEQLRKLGGEIDWSRLDIFWGDERFVPTGDAERNELQARRALFDHVPVDPSRVHPVAASDGEYPDPVEAAAEYSATVHAHLAEFGSFDLHLLGMGGEGHVNSLFPHTDATREQHELVVAVTNSPKPPPVRVTLTLPAVQRARHVVLIVGGEAKAAAVAAALAGASHLDIPAAGAKGSESTTWLLDEAAAADLPR